MILQEIMKNYNTWNIRHLVDESFVQATNLPIDPAYYIEDCRIYSPCEAFQQPPGQLVTVETL